MEGRAVIPAILPSVDNKTLTYGEILDEYCAFYMSIGVPCEEFWRGDYTRLKHYIRAFEMKSERELEQRNYELYLAGLYNYNAMSSVVGTYMWWKAGKKGRQPDGYMQKPLPVTEREKQADLEERKRRTIEWFKKGQE